MSREDERGLGGLDPSGVSNLSLKSKNKKKPGMSCRERESLIKSGLEHVGPSPVSSRTGLLLRLVFATGEFPLVKIKKAYLYL